MAGETRHLKPCCDMMLMTSMGSVTDGPYIMTSMGSVTDGPSIFVVFQGVSCHVCRKPFSRRDSLRRHLREVHRREKTHQCSVCQRAFAQKATLEDHIRRLHTKNKAFRCKACQATFTIKRDLKRHIAKRACFSD